MVAIKKRIQQCVSRIGSTFFVGVVSFAFTTSVFANPVLDNVAHGNVSVQQTATTTTVNQATQKGIINWKSFNINQGEHTHFNQPNGGVTLNRISPNQGASQIFGQLSATGKIILVNPAGVFIGPSAFVNVGGLIASTAGITNENFLNGYYNFDQLSPHANAIVNQGTIIAADHGLVALMGHAVSNEGHIQANLGKVVLASGDAFTMTFAGNELISFVVDQEVMQQGVDAFGNSLADGVKNTGTITANGGQVLVHAKAASNVLDHAINMEGAVQANSVQQVNGEIILRADNAIESIVRVAGTLEARGDDAGETGGDISVLGYNLLIDEGAELNASGDTGGGNVRVGGNYLGLGPLPNANATLMAPDSSIYADAITNGDGGEIILWADDFTNVWGNLYARGGSENGDGGFIETSSKELLNVGDIAVDASAANGEAGTWLLDPRDVTITSSTSSGSFDGGDPNIFTPSANDATVSNTTIQSNLSNADVTITTGTTGSQNGDITVSSGITWTSSNTLKLNAAGDIIINAGISGINGTLVLSGVNSSSITTGVSGTIAVANFDLLQGNWSQNTASLPAFSVTNNFTLQSGSRFLRVAGGDGDIAGAGAYQLEDVFGLQGIESSNAYRTDDWILNNDIDASTTVNWNSGAGFVPIGSFATTKFSGDFNGQDFAIDNLYINRPASTDQALFGVTDSASSISNLRLTNPTVTGGQYTGSLVGRPDGTITNVHATNINITADVGSGGGLIGIASSASSNISNSSTTGTLTSTGSNVRLGGFAGGVRGSVSNSWSSVTVTAYDSENVGGFVGKFDFVAGGNISDAYSIGAVIGDNNVGGFAGGFSIAGTLTNVYSTGNVTGNTNVGGLVGDAGSSLATVNNSFWDTDTSGTTTGIGAGTTASGTPTGSVFGGETGELAEFDTYDIAGWSITSTPSTTATAPTETWFIFDDATRPMLMMEYSTNIRNAHQLQLVGSTLDGTYTLANDIDLNPGMTNAADVWGTNRNTNTGAGWEPIGTYTNTGFDGSFNGQYNVIDNLYIKENTTKTRIGLFGFVEGSGTTVQNLGITNLYISDTDAGGTGGLAGETFVGPTITNVYTTGDISIGSGSYVGGLVGTHNQATIQNSYSGVNVSIDEGGKAIGGLVGDMRTSGASTSLVQNTYSYGSVTAGGTNSTNGGGVGGLIGMFAFFGTGNQLKDSYSSGLVTATGTFVGGLLGNKDNGAATGTVTNSFWDTQTSGQATSYGSTGVAGYRGMTTSDMMWTYALGSAGTYISGTPWSISEGEQDSLPNTTWFMLDSATRPILMMEYSTTIKNAHQLQLANANRGENYTLANDIDLNPGMTNAADVWGTNKNTNTGFGFVPIGVSGDTNTPYTGTFNGNNNAIKNLYIIPPSSGVGLFAKTNGATIQNLMLLDVDIQSPASSTAALVGFARDSIINNIYASGTISAAGAGIGGIVGTAEFDLAISNVASNVNLNVPSSFSSNVGGLVGETRDHIIDISNSYNIGIINTSAQNVGGLVGYIDVYINITNSYNTGAVSGSANVGGLIGSQRFPGNPGTIINSFWDGDTSGVQVSPGSTAVAGGSAGTAGYMRMTTAEMKTLANFNTAANGFVTTDNAWSITSTPSTTSVKPSETWFIFDGNTRPILMSEHSTNIRNTHQLQLAGTTLGADYTLANDIDLSAGMTNEADAWGTNAGVSGAGWAPIGTNNSHYTGVFDGQNYEVSNLYINSSASYSGLFGYIDTTASVSNLGLANASITTTAQQVGTLAGRTDGTVNNVWSRNLTLNTTNWYNGGMFGTATGNITNAWATGTFTNSGPVGRDYAGGITSTYGGGTMTSVWNGVNVSAANLNYVGGIVGANTGGGTITNSYSTGVVTGKSIVGGISGYNSGSIDKVYATGKVTANSASGALNGYNYGTITNSLWDTATTGKSNSLGANFGGLTVTTTGGCFGATSCTGGGTVDLTKQASYQATTGYNWDFTNTWGIIEDQSYPYLRAAHPITPRVISGTSSAVANTDVNLIVNGELVDTVKTGNNGFFYYLSSTDAIADSSNLLAYLNTDGSTIGNSVAVVPTSGDSLSGETGLTITDDTLTISGGGTVTSANINTALGSYTDANDILFTIDGSDNLTLDSGKHFASTTNTTFTADGNVTTSSGGGITINGALQLNDNITLNGDAITLLGGTTGLTSTRNLSITNAGTSSISGNITTNVGTFTKDGAGTLTLSGTNTYSGVTTINGGRLVISNDAALGSATGIGAIVLNNGALRGNVTINSSRGITLAGGVTGLGGDGGTMSYGGTITGTATSLNINTPNSTLELSGINTFVADIYIGGNNTLNASSDLRLGNTSNNVIFGDVNGWGRINTQSTTFAFNSNRTFTTDGNSGTTNMFLQVDGSVTFDGSITGTYGLTKQGAGTLTLGGTNSYLGTTSIQSGSIKLTNQDALGTGSGDVSNTANIELAFNGTLGNTGSFTTLAGSGTSGEGALTFSDSAILTNAMTLTGDTTISSTGSAIAILTGNIAANGNDLTFKAESTSRIDHSTGVISGSGTTLNITGASTVRLFGANTFDGGVNLSSGRLVNSNDSGLGTGTLTFMNGGTGTYAALGNRTITNLIALTGSGIIDINNATTNFNGALSGPGTLVINDGDPSTSSSAKFNAIGTRSGTTTISNNADVRILADNALGTGDITIQSGGTLSIGLTESLIPNNITINGSGKSLLANSAALQIFPSTTATLSGTITLDTADASISNSTNTNISQLVTGSGGLTKYGSAILTLSNTTNNTYAGNTTINDGILSINNPNKLGSGSKIILGGGTLRTTSSLALVRDIELSSGDNIIDNSVGTLTINSIINGNNALTLSGAGSGGIILAGTVGGVTPVGSITANTPIAIENTITTNGDQTYNQPVTLNVNATLTMNGSSTSTLSLTNGISGDKDLVLNGTGSGTYNFILGNSLALTSLSVTGSTNSTNNKLSLLNSNQLTFNITNNNTGNVTNTAGISGSTTFTRIQNLTGGTNGNQFNFADGVRIDGFADGTNANINNTVNLTAYTTPLHLVMSGTNSGQVSTNNNVKITGIRNITNLNNNSNQTNSSITLAALPNNDIVITQPFLGSINDIFNFNNFTTITGHSTKTDRVYFNQTTLFNLSSGSAKIGENNDIMQFNTIGLAVVQMNEQRESTAKIIESGQNNVANQTIASTTNYIPDANIDNVTNNYNTMLDLQQKKINIISGASCSNSSALNGNQLCITP